MHVYFIIVVYQIDMCMRSYIICQFQIMYIISVLSTKPIYIHIYVCTLFCKSVYIKNNIINLSAKIILMIFEKIYSSLLE